MDHKRKVIASYDGTEINYDMLVSIPPNFGAQVMIDSGISDPMGFIPVDNHMAKLMFKWAYFNLLLKGVWLGPPDLMMEGENRAA